MYIYIRIKLEINNKCNWKCYGLDLHCSLKSCVTKVWSTPAGTPRNSEALRYQVWWDVSHWKESFEEYIMPLPSLPHYLLHPVPPSPQLLLHTTNFLTYVFLTLLSLSGFHEVSSFAPAWETYHCDSIAGW